MTEKNTRKEGGLRAAFLTLGCRVNQYETQALEETFRQNGFSVGSFDEVCDVYVINTCTVTQESDRKSRQAIRRATAKKRPGGVVIVCGCYAQKAPKEALAIEGVDAVFGTSKKNEICAEAMRLLCEKKRTTCDLVEDIAACSSYEEMRISSSDRTRAFVKIVDGCENRCTYCIIPSVRGPVRSRASEDVVSEVRRLAQNGYREVVLTGIETAAYGKDFPTAPVLPLASLLCEVSKIEGIERIRLGSMEPTVFREKFVEAIASLPKVCPHFHLSLQSGSDSVLRRMKRKYNTAQFFEVVQRLRRHIPDVQITTDIIVGFPGETEEEFEETKAFVRRCRFAFVHIFPYSRRAGTEAATLPGQLTGDVKKARVASLERVMLEVRREVLSGFVGRALPVLLETDKNGTIDGYTPQYLAVSLPTGGKTGLSGTIQNVKIEGVAPDAAGLYGVLCDAV